MPELKNTRKLLYCHSKRALATEESCKIDHWVHQMKVMIIELIAN